MRGLPVLAIVAVCEDRGDVVLAPICPREAKPWLPDPRADPVRLLS